MASRQTSSILNRQNNRQAVPSSTSFYNPSSLVNTELSLAPFGHQNARQTVVPFLSLSNPSSMVLPGQSSSSFNCQTVPASSRLCNQRSIVPAQATSGFHMENARPPVPPSSPFALQNARNTAPPSPYFSKGVTGNSSRDISMELTLACPVSNDIANLSGTSWAPIEILDSPVRENSTYHHAECQSTYRAKRLREIESELQDCIDQSHKNKKARMEYPSQNQIIKAPQNKSELPSFLPDAMMPGRSSSSNNCLNYAQQTVPASTHHYDPRSMVPKQVSTGFQMQNARQKAPSSPNLSNPSSMVPSQVSSHSNMQNPRQPAPPSSRLCNPSSTVPGRVSSHSNMQNARNTENISTQILHLSSVLNDDKLLSTYHQLDKCQRARLRDIEAELEACLVPQPKFRGSIDLRRLPGLIPFQP